MNEASVREVLAKVVDPLLGGTDGRRMFESLIETLS